MSINFIIDNFETNISLDVSGTMLGEPDSFDASSNAIIEVDLALVKQAFQFQSDASEVLNLAPTDVKFYLSETPFWNSGFKYNVADADEQMGGTVGPIATGYPSNKNMVCHDFIRFLSLRLFNTYNGVDLFDNEKDLLDDIRLKSVDVWTKMESELAKYNDFDGTHIDLKTDSAGKKYSTNEVIDSIVRKLYEQMISTLSGRERFKNMITGDRQDLPFQADDTIQIKIIINPESNQHLLTNVGALEPRSYKIIYKLKDSPVAPSRDNLEGIANFSYV